ncbi:hypothetical protein ACQPUZ_09975 [Clostridium tertium]
MKQEVKKILGLSLISFKTKLVYKTNSLIILLSGIITALVQFYLWTSVEQSSLGSNTDIDSIILYTLMSILVNLLLPTKEVADYFSKLIYKGDIMTVMMHPYSLFNHIFFYQIGNSLFVLCFEFIPLLLAFIVFFPIKINVLLQYRIIIFIISFIISYISSIIIGYMIGLMAIYTTTVKGIFEFYNAMLIFLGGSIFPLIIYPKGLAFIANYMPFYSIVGAPLSIVSGISDNYIYIILKQVFWVGILIFLVMYLNKKNIKNLSIMGG